MVGFWAFPTLGFEGKERKEKQEVEKESRKIKRGQNDFGGKKTLTVQRT